MPVTELTLQERRRVDGFCSDLFRFENRHPVSSLARPVLGVSFPPHTADQAGRSNEPRGCPNV
jgi:hypothetical protein